MQRIEGKAVVVARVSRAVVERNRLRLLSYLAGLAEDNREGIACISLGRMAVELGLSESKLRLARRRLEQDGCIRCVRRTAENGGTLENGYHVTRQGLDRLAQARRNVEA